MNCLLIVLLAGIPSGVPAAGPPSSRPNIVLILADDYGYGSAGCYGADGKLIRTPHIDRLAREGRRFTDANTTSSVCSPTRYSVLTGRYCWRTSLTHEVLGTFSPLHIEPGRLNLASLLKKHGYQTAAIGKWHLGYGTPDSTPQWRTDYTAELKPGPLEVGFDYHFGVPSNHGDVTGVYVENHFVYGLRSGKIPAGMKPAGPVPDSDDFKPTYTQEDLEGKTVTPIEIDAPRRVNDRVMPLLTKKAVEWIGRQKADRPFFLYYTPVAVHSPVTPSKDQAGRSAAGPYGDWIQELDQSVGGVLAALDERGLANNTLVIFTSDNGGVKVPQRTDMPQTVALNAGLAVNGPWRGGKHSVWQGGFRVPFLVRWPGKAPAATTCDAMISLADLLATTAAVVGETLPPAAQAAEDSYNFVPAIVGQAAPAPRREMIVHSADGVFAVRKGPWKWIEGLPVDEIRAGVRKLRADEFHPQLYHLENDPAETTDVSAQHPEIARELERLLDRYRDGGYSRALPPANARPAAAVTLPPPLPKVLSEERLDKIPAAPWVQVRGRWMVRDGAVRASERPVDRAGAAMRSPLAVTDADLEYEVCLPPATVHVLRIQCRERSHVLLVYISPRRLAIRRQPAEGEAVGPPIAVAEERVKLGTNQWHKVRIALRGSEVIVAAGDARLKAAHPFFGEPKIAFALMAQGEDIGFRNMRVLGGARE